MTRHLNEAVRAPPRALPPSLAHIFGYHKEELLARYAAREAEPLYFELDSIVFFINDCRRGFPLLQAPAGAAARALSRANPEARRDACVVARLLAMSAVAPSERDGGAFPVTCRGARGGTAAGTLYFQAHRRTRRCSSGWSPAASPCLCGWRRARSLMAWAASARRALRDGNLKRSEKNTPSIAPHQPVRLA